MRKRLALCSWSLMALLSVAASVGVATAGVCTEDFTSTLHRDAGLTTAWWDTTADGELKLHPFAPGLVGSCALSGECYAVQVAGKYAFVAAGTGGLWVLDISDPTAPVRVGHYDTPGTTYDVCVAGDRAVLADGTSTVKLLDISNPISPTLMAWYGALAEARGVCMDGGIIYVAYGARGLVMLTYGPVGLVQVGAITTPGTALDVQVADFVAYVADDSQGLQLYDVRDPANPELIAGYNTSGSARSVRLAGDLAYVADGPSGLQVIDISNPTAPSLAGSYDTAEARGVWLDGDGAYVADADQGLLILDVSDPSLPTLVATVATPGAASGLQVCGEQVYVAAGTQGLQVADVRDPAVPSWITHVPLGDSGRGVEVVGDLAYVAAYVFGGLKIVDVTDPTAPVVIGTYNTPGFAMDVAVSGDHAYVADYDQGLQVVDVSDPTNPVPAGTWNSPNNAMAVCVAGDMVYLADYGSNLQVVDVSDPHHPTPVGSYDTDGLGYGICVDGSHVFLADAEGGVRIFDVSIPSAPISLGICPTLNASIGAFATGDRLYVADGEAGLQIFDIRVPALPLRLGGCDTPGSARRVQVSGRYAFVTDWSPGLHVFDVGDPTAPVLVATIDPQDNSMDVALAGDYAYVSGSGFGMEIVQVWQEDLDTEHDQGGSLPLAPSEGDAQIVSKVRLTAEQVGSVTWQVQTTPTGAGPLWQEILPDGAWHPVAAGWDLRWLSTHAWSPGVNPTVSELTLEWLSPAAGLTIVSDVPDDQGGWLHVQFLRSTLDFAGEMFPIVSYGIWRRVDDPLEEAAVAEMSPTGRDSGAKTAVPAVPTAVPAMPELGDLPVVTWQGRTFLDPAKGVEPSPFFPPGIWEWVATVPALQIDTYLAAVPTLRDWTPTEAHRTALVVTAHTTSPSLWYVSLPDSGSSHDNIAPGVPEGLSVAYQTGGNQLAWDPCPDEDFQYFNVYRGDAPDFVPSPATLVHSTIDQAWTDPAGDGWHVWYKLTALDHVGNESDAAAAVTVTGTPSSDLPSSPVLRGNVPNPFNPMTEIRYALPATAAVDLRIYDLRGRLVRVLLAGQQREAGPQAEIWDGRDTAGREAPAGVYFCRLEAAGRRLTGKMDLVR